MPAWLQKIFVNWLLSNLTQERLQQWADAAKQYVVPFLRASSDKILDALGEAAKGSETSIDDDLVAALRTFVDAFLPDNTTTL